MSTPTAHADDRTPLGDLNEGGMHRLLGYRLAQATIGATRAFEREVGKPLALRPVEFTILQLVHENALASPTRLSRALDITLPGVKMWLDRLEQRKLLRRKIRDADRRSHKLELTREGTRVVIDALDRLFAADQALLQTLSVGEQHILLELLDKVARARVANAAAMRSEGESRS